MAGNAEEEEDPRAASIWLSLQHFLRSPSGLPALPKTSEEDDH